jgi:hypothetical protein
VKRATNARIAGITLLAYIAAGLTSMALFGRAAAGEAIPARLASIAQHAPELRIVLVLSLLESFAALVLAVTLHAITRDHDPDLAMLALVCRTVEGVLVGLSVSTTLALRWLAGETGLDAGAASALGGYLLRNEVALTASFFAVGSALFAWLLLRGRAIPAPLAGLGVLASLLLVVGLPLQLAGWIGGAAASLLWLPMLAFEVPLGLWLVVRGVAPAPVSG